MSLYNRGREQQDRVAARRAMSTREKSINEHTKDFLSERSASIRDVEREEAVETFAVRRHTKQDGEAEAKHEFAVANSYEAWRRDMVIEERAATERYERDVARQEYQEYRAMLVEGAKKQQMEHDEMVRREAAGNWDGKS